MKRKTFTLLASVALILSPVALHAAQALPLLSARPMLQMLNFTATQKAQFQSIREQTRTTIAQILTPAQKSEIKQSLAQGKTFQMAIADSSLSDVQKQQIRQTLETARLQVSEVLTPQQRQQIFNLVTSAPIR